MGDQLAIQRKIAKFGPNPSKTFKARVLRKGGLGGTVSWARWESLLGSEGQSLGLGGTVSLLSHLNQNSVRCFCIICFLVTKSK